MTIDLYLIPASPPCRAVLMTARYLDIPVNKKVLDFKKQESLKPEFVKMNPQHCTPTINDNGFVLWESRAIMTYLVNQYAPDSSLYPQDPAQRAIVDRVLNFDVGTLFVAIKDFIRPQAILGQPPDAEKEVAFKKALDTFEALLGKTPYAAGQNLTLADLSTFASLSFAEFKEGHSYEAFSNISAWIRKLKQEIPGDREINEEPIRQFRESLGNR